MSRSISSIVAAQLGRRDEALSLFRACYRPHLYGPFYALAETPDNGAVELPYRRWRRPAGAALRLRRDCACTMSALAARSAAARSGWQALRFPALQWRGQSISLAILPGDLAVIGLAEDIELTLQRWRPGDAPLVVESRGLEGMECTLRAEDWRVEPRFGADIGWWLYPRLAAPPARSYG